MNWSLLARGTQAVCFVNDSYKVLRSPKRLLYGGSGVGPVLHHFFNNVADPQPESSGSGIRNRIFSLFNPREQESENVCIRELPDVKDTDMIWHCYMMEEKEATVLTLEESLLSDSNRCGKIRRSWRGPMRLRRMPCQPPWSEEDCQQRVDTVVRALLAIDDRVSWAVANVLDEWVGKITRVDLSNVMKELGYQQDVVLAFEVFKWMQQQKRRLKPNGHTYSLILGVLGRAGLTSNAREVFDSMPSSGVEVVVHSYNAMLGAYARNGSFKKAWRLYEDMVAKGIHADEITFNTLLSGVGKADLPAEKAEKIFFRIKQKGVLPTVHSYNSLMSVLSKAGYGEKASALIDEMHSLEILADLVTYNTLLHMHAQAGRVEEAREVSQNLVDAGFVPNVVTYTSLIQMYSRAAKHESAIDMFIEMQRLGCSPDLSTYSLMVAVYGKAGLEKEAADVFRIMQEAGHKPNVVAWSSIIQVFTRQGKFQEVGTYFNEMLAAGCQPDLTLYNILMGAYGRGGHSVQAAILFRRMLAHGVIPNAVSYDIMIQAYCQARQPTDAQGVYDQMTKAGYSPDNISSLLLQSTGLKFPDDSRFHLSRKARGGRKLHRPPKRV